MPTKDLWFLPQGGPGRHYMLDYEFVALDNAGRALAMRMYRKLAAGDVSAEPQHSVVLAFNRMAVEQLLRTHSMSAEGLDAFLLKTAERAASCLDMRLPPPIEPEVPKGHVVWLSSGDYASERTLTHTILTALG